ncbi:casein kinase substrate phosphoprotein PP28 [Purpureocillium lilacinum]|uniref:Casein kinase substrate phosphoprotein PP28 n=1 Tax=Purpureocillium lilacinum TaxID=33203 RepID=A0A179GMP9_PURLI|nr:casein kinase substrate phosphoprotein PP28 [Purpureocillium lilacinum]OAQ79165.1 casein kinase substrate phosphoprotein PP28 [Purpureocillium lilacinum]OAQ93079.1 casein kinase substrate phosphoprotein PP28 [Purpureocillium lilacinum]GJN71570.1 hypothetical protein PLICBS_005638 [Purpureocillium lilacinum]GJN82553.1 hypothetical protein PLIIFM63780_006093 [Purpureocillium lilacinum]
MAGGPSATAARRGGKFNKPSRGGGKHYSRGLQPVDADGNQISMWSADSQKREEGDEEDSEEESSEEESEEEGGPSNAAAAAAAEANREDRKAQKKARKEAALAKQRARNVEVGDMPSSDDDDESDDDMPANPNHSKASRNMTKAPSGDDVDEITQGVQDLKAPASRREREALAAAEAKEKYMRLHAAGKTDEAKADLARLKVIREQRAAEAARRQAEKEEKEEQEKARKAEIEAKEAKKREAAAGPKKSSKKK